MSKSKKKKQKRQNKPAPTPVVQSSEAELPAEAPKAQPTAAAKSKSAAAKTEPFWMPLVREPIALGIALYVLFRPWRDGLTYPSFNTYFLWLALFMTALWAARQLMRGEPIRFRAPLALFAGFLVIALLTAFDTVQVNSTYRSMLFWIGFFCLFLLCTNALRTRLSMAIVLGAFLLTTAAGGAWAVIHFHYVLPPMRELVESRPELIPQFFGMNELTPELRKRLETNRAFGTMLYPNALAAMLILAVPFVIGEIPLTIKRFRDALACSNARTDEERQQAEQARMFTAVACAFLSGVIIFVLAYAVYPVIFGLMNPEVNWLDSPLRVAFFMGIAPLGVAVAAFLVTRQHGPWTFLHAVQLLLLPASLLALLWGLRLTFSRGGMLGLVAAAALCALLLTPPISGFLRKRIFRISTVATMLIAGLIAGPAIADEFFVHPLDPESSLNPDPSDVDLTGGQLRLEGVDLGVAELADTSSLRIRLTYWWTGLMMAREHFWTGVGLGNFGTMYPQYQYIGAGDVQTAHNDYLQVFAETGVFGGLMFIGFWGYFVLWGARRILIEPDVYYRIALAGLYGGVVAFLVHSLVDFNFYNPTLVSLAFFAAGAFYARARIIAGDGEEEAAHSTRFYRLIAIPLLAVLALTMGSALRVYLVDYALTDGSFWTRVYNVGDRGGMRDRLNLATHILRDMKGQQLNPQEPKLDLWQNVSRLIPSVERVQSFARIRVRLPGEQNGQVSVRPLAEGEIPPPDALVQYEDLNAAQAEVMRASEEWTSYLETMDAVYPNDPEIAAMLFEWYDVMQSAATDPLTQRQYIEKCMEWATKGVERNPKVAGFYHLYGKAFWLRASVDSSGNALDDYYEGLDQYEHATELFPTSSLVWEQYSVVSFRLAEVLNQTGRDKDGAELMAKSQEARVLADKLRALKLD